MFRKTWDEDRESDRRSKTPRHLSDVSGATSKPPSPPTTSPTHLSTSPVVVTVDPPRLSRRLVSIICFCCDFVEFKTKPNRNYVCALLSCLAPAAPYFPALGTRGSLFFPRLAPAVPYFPALGTRGSLFSRAWHLLFPIFPRLAPVVRFRFQLLGHSSNRIKILHF